MFNFAQHRGIRAFVGLAVVAAATPVLAVGGAPGGNGGGGTLGRVDVYDATVVEGDSGTTTAEVTVEVSGNVKDDVVVDWHTSDASAVAPDDYLARSGQVVLTRKQRSAVLVFDVLGDTDDEANEIVHVVLSSVTNADISDGLAEVTIVDDDLPASTTTTTAAPTTTTTAAPTTTTVAPTTTTTVAPTTTTVAPTTTTTVAPTTTTVAPTTTTVAPTTTTVAPTTTTVAPTTTTVAPTTTTVAPTTTTVAPTTTTGTTTTTSTTTTIPPSTTTTGTTTTTSTTSTTTTTTPPTGTTTSSTTTTTTPGRTVRIAAGGDIACDPGSGAFNDGAGTETQCTQMATSDLLLAGGYDAVLALGDLQYSNATLDKFMASYDPSWGRLFDLTYPAIGNHEYYDKSAGTGALSGQGYFDYFGARAGDRDQAWYSFDLGEWHLVALNSNCGYVGGCGAGSDQEQWLRADLAASSAECTIAYWHHPRFTSGSHGDDPAMTDLWAALMDHGVDVVLAGHDHDYERLAPMDSLGNADASGPRSFVVGSSGKNLTSFVAMRPNSEAGDDTSFGILDLTLRPDGYDWAFVGIPGTTFTDTGSADCI